MKSVTMLGALFILGLCAIPLVDAFQLFGGSQKGFDTSTAYDKRPMTAYSFKPPFYLVRGSIPFWKFEGDTVVTDEFVRLTPAEKSRKGAIWGTKPHAFEHWEVEMKYKVGSSQTVGADGFAFWYAQGGYREGPVYGSQDMWKGLGIFFDTFDNDNMGDNPRIGAFYNDGSWTYGDRDPNGANELGGCRCMYRNMETQVKISYYDGNLQLLYKLNPGADWTHCFNAKVNLPTGYTFGISAATGGLADNHDIYSFEGFRLIPRKDVNVNQMQQQQQDYQQQNQNQQQQQNSGDSELAQILQRQREETERLQRELADRNAPKTPEVQPTIADDTRFQGIKDRLNQLRQDNQQQQQQDQQQQQQQQQAPPVQQQQNFVQPTPVPQQQQQQAPPVQQQQQVPQHQQQQRTAGSDKELNDIKEDIDTLASEFHGVVEAMEFLSKSFSSMQAQQSQIVLMLQTISSASPLKADIEGVMESIHSLGQVITSQSGQSSSNSASLIQDLRQQLNSLAQVANDIRGKVDHTKQQQSSLEQNLQKNHERINETIGSSSSPLPFYLTLFVIFQVVFGAAYVWWKKAKDETNKKLW